MINSCANEADELPPLAGVAAAPAGPLLPSGMSGDGSMIDGPGLGNKSSAVPASSANNTPGLGPVEPASRHRA